MASSDPSTGDEREVLAGLPNARPQRRSAKRDRAAGTKSARGGAKPTSSGATKVPPAGYATPTEAASDAPKGADLFTTAVQAVGELAQIGVALGARTVKSALHRLPRP